MFISAFSFYLSYLNLYVLVRFKILFKSESLSKMLY